MNKYLLTAVVLFGIISCHPKLTTNIINAQPATTENEVIILKVGDSIPANAGIEVGNLHAGDNGFSTNCSYDENIKILRGIASRNGANVLKITELIPANGHKSSCDRIRAKIYRVKNPRQYEKEIEWSSSRKLTWNDFKGSAPKSGKRSKYTAETHASVTFRTNYVTIFTKIEPFITNYFICDSSWVKPEGLSSDQLLAHEQAHFDMSEVFAREVRKELAETKLTLLNSVVQASEIYNKLSGYYYRRQNRFDDETDHGRNKANEKEWEETIQKELKELEAYAVK